MTLRAITTLTLVLAIRAIAYPVGLTPSPDGSTLFVALEHPPSVVRIHTATGKTEASWNLPATPTSIAASPDGGTLAVTAGLAPGKLILLDSVSGRQIRSHPAGHSPVHASWSPNGQSIFTTSQFENRISAISPESGTTGTLPAVREPVATTISADGNTLFTANLLPHGPANTGHTAAAITVTDIRSGQSINLSLPNGSIDLRALALSPDGRFLYAVHTLARYQVPTTQLDRGWMNTSALSIIRTAGTSLLATVLLDDTSLGAANPSAIACSPDGRLLAVAHAGTHEVSLIDRRALHADLDRLANGESVTAVSSSLDDVPNDLSFIHRIRRRIKLNGNGPRHLAVTHRGFAVTCHFSSTLHLIHTGDGLQATVRDIPLPRPRAESPARTGERLFYDGTRSFQHWQSCATCHPGTRTDALNWDLLNDGLGNPKQSKNMLFSMQTPPAMVSGIRADAPTAIRAGMRHIQFISYPDEDARAIEAYFLSLQPVPSPALENGRLSESAKRGKSVFHTAKCAVCHDDDHFTDMTLHNVGTGTGREQNTKWDTPTLREVWRTAPYLHNGRAATLMDVITSHNPADRHGKTSQLTERQKLDLVAYLRSL